jgi:hypothetical protein
VGLNEKTWLDDGGHLTAMLSRYRRFRLIGHMEVQVTIDDPKAYTKPWTFKDPRGAGADTDLFDWVCESEEGFHAPVGVVTTLPHDRSS